MSERAFVCQLTLLNIDTYSNILIESSINTNEMYSRVNEKLIYVIDITFGINESIFSGNEQQKVYYYCCYYYYYYYYYCRYYLCTDLAKPKSGVLVSLFSSPSLYWMKTVINLISTGCRSVLSVEWKTSSGGGEVGKNWRGLEPGDDVLTTTHMLVSGIFRQVTTVVIALDVVTKFSKIRSVVFFRWSAWYQHQLKLYSIERDL